MKLKGKFTCRLNLNKARNANHIPLNAKPAEEAKAKFGL